MNVRCGGIKAGLYDQRLSRLIACGQFLLQIFGINDFGGAADKNFQRLFYGHADYRWRGSYKDGTFPILRERAVSYIDLTLNFGADADLHLFNVDLDYLNLELVTRLEGFGLFLIDF